MVLTLLRERTRADHERLEGMLPLMRPDLTLARYRDLISRFHALYRLLEGAAEASSEWAARGFDLGPRRKLPLLERDCRALGAAPLDAIPASALDGLDHFEHLLGCQYVLEGATLGGRLISRHLAAHLGLDATSGAAFFHSYGDDVGPRWRSFLEFLEGQAQTPAAHAAVVEGAGRTFRLFQAHLADAAP